MATKLLLDVLRLLGVLLIFVLAVRFGWELSAWLRTMHPVLAWGGHLFAALVLVQWIEDQHGKG